MKKFLSVVLSLTMLLTTAVFAAPMAVVPESAEEYVPANTIQQETSENVDLSGEAGDPYSVKYGVREMLTDFDGEGVSAPTGSGVETELVDYGTGKALKITHKGGDGVYAFLPVNSGKITFNVTDYNYTLFAETVQATGTLSVSFGSNNWAYLLAKVNEGEKSSFADSGYRVITLTGSEQFGGGITNKETGETSGPICLAVNPASEGASKTVDNIGIYKKPKQTAVATSAVNHFDGTVTVTYPQGVYADSLNAILTDPTIIDGVKSAELVGESLVFAVERDRDIVIPALVNSNADATYNEVNVNISSGDVFSVKYGIREMFVSFDDLTTAPASSEYVSSQLVNNGNGKALELTSISNGGYSFFKINDKAITFNVDTYDYTLFAETVAASGKFDMSFSNTWTYLLSTSLNEGEKRGFVNSGYSVMTITSTAQFGSGAFNGNTTNSPIHLIVNPSEAGTSKTLDNIGIYKKPKATAVATSVINHAENTVTVTYPQGVYADSLNAILTDPAIIDGVKSAELVGESLVFTVERDTDIVIPALVNSEANATYNEVAVNIKSGDEFSVRHGVKQMLVTFDEEGLSAPEATVSGLVTTALVDNGNGKALQITSNGNTSHAFVKIYNNLTFDVANNDYYLFAQVLDSVGKLDVSYGNHWTYLLSSVVVEGEKIGFAKVGYNVTTLKQSSQFGAINSNTGVTDGNLHLVIDPAEAGASKTIDNLGVYYKPKNDIAVTSVVNNGGDTIKITYSEGILEDSLNAILCEPSILNADSASFENNVLTLTAANVNVISVPALVNADMTATYEEVNGVTAPIGDGEVEIRTSVKECGMGLRSTAKVNSVARSLYGDENVEYGTLVTLERMLTANNLGADELTFETKSKTEGEAPEYTDMTVISNASYNRDGITNKLTIDGEYEFFSAVFVGIPPTVENYKLNLVFRPYVKYTLGEVTSIVYGEPVCASPLSVATKISQTAPEGDLKNYCLQIVDACAGKEGIMLPGAAANQ